MFDYNYVKQESTTPIWTVERKYMDGNKSDKQT